MLKFLPNHGFWEGLNFLGEGIPLIPCSQLQQRLHKGLAQSLQQGHELRNTIHQHLLMGSSSMDVNGQAILHYEVTMKHDETLVNHRIHG